MYNIQELTGEQCLSALWVRGLFGSVMLDMSCWHDDAAAITHFQSIVFIAKHCEADVLIKFLGEVEAHTADIISDEVMEKAARLITAHVGAAVHRLQLLRKLNLDLIDELMDLIYSKTKENA